MTESAFTFELRQDPFTDEWQYGLKGPSGVPIFNAKRFATREEAEAAGQAAVERTGL